MADRHRVTIASLREMASSGTPITWLTGYDYPSACLLEEAGIDMILVGDSLGMTMLGYESTLPVTMDDMIRHTQAVRRGSPNVFLVGDMPYMSYQPSNETAVRNAARFMAEAACDAIKLEGGREMAERVRAIVAAGIPTIGHLGLTPQSASAQGGFRLQGKGAAQAERIARDASILADAGAFAILLELVPDRLCEAITQRAGGCIVLSLGSGPHAHGQLLIYHDLFGLYPRPSPRMAKQYADVGSIIRQGLRDYIDEVHSGAFPTNANYFGMRDEEHTALMQRLKDDSLD